MRRFPRLLSSSLAGLIGVAALVGAALGSARTAPPPTGDVTEPPAATSAVGAVGAPGGEAGDRRHRTPVPQRSPADSSGPPGAADRARFVAGHRPPGARHLRHVSVDLDGGHEELLVAYVGLDDRASHVDVAAWRGGRYEIVARVAGGRAQRLRDLVVDDINRDGRVDVVILQDHVGGSLSAWTTAAGRLVPLRARGGCADGGHTYGIVGARLLDSDGDGRLEIDATCDDSPLPMSAWSTDRYAWSQGAYRLAGDPALAAGTDATNG